MSTGTRWKGPATTSKSRRPPQEERDGMIPNINVTSNKPGPKSFSIGGASKVGGTVNIFDCSPGAIYDVKYNQTDPVYSFSKSNPQTDYSYPYQPSSNDLLGREVTIDNTTKYKKAPMASFGASTRGGGHVAQRSPGAVYEMDVGRRIVGGLIQWKPKYCDATPQTGPNVSPNYQGMLPRQDVFTSKQSKPYSYTFPKKPLAGQKERKMDIYVNDYYIDPCDPNNLYKQASSTKRSPEQVVFSQGTRDQRAKLAYCDNPANPDALVRNTQMPHNTPLPQWQQLKYGGDIWVCPLL